MTKQVLEVLFCLAGFVKQVVLLWVQNKFCIPKVTCRLLRTGGIKSLFRLAKLCLENPSIEIAMYARHIIFDNLTARFFGYSIFDTPKEYKSLFSTQHIFE